MVTRQPQELDLPTDQPDRVVPGGVIQWIIEHDDRWAFTILYVGAAVVLSIWISLFWLVVVVAAHAVLEWIRQRYLDAGLVGVAQRVAWELKLDVALVLLAMAVAVYMDVILGAAGLGGAARLGLQGGARAAGWGRAIQGVLISVDDAAQLARVALRRKARGESLEAARKIALHPWRRWGLGDWIAMLLAVACVALLFAAPGLIGMPAGQVLQLLAEEFHPWP